jgi:CheY-like chemotaxis protein
MARQKETRRILVVDDDPDWREVLRIALEDMGYQAVEASSGPEALELMQIESFPVVLLDNKMPGMDGQEVIARMPRPLPRIVLLTASDAGEVIDTLASGPLYYMPKDGGTDTLPLVLGSLHG